MEFLFSSYGAIAVSFVIVMVVANVYNHFKNDIPYFKDVERHTKITICVILSIILTGFTWHVLLTGGAIKSTLDPDIIANLTVQSIEDNLARIHESEEFSNLQTRNHDSSSSLRRVYSFNYRRGESFGLVSCSIILYRSEDDAIKNFVNRRKAQYFSVNENEILIGQIIMPKTSDTFYMPSSRRYTTAEIRIENYVISLIESTYSYQIDDLRISDVIRMLSE